MTQAQARAALDDAIALWWLAPGNFAGEVVDAATDALVAGVDSPTLRELAGAPRDTLWHDLQPLVEATIAELDLAPLSPDRERTVMAIWARGYLAGRLDRERLLSYAWGLFGFEGDPACHGFVELAYLEDAADVSLEERELWARQECEAFLAGRPSPALARWPSAAPEDALSWWSRLRGRLRRSGSVAG